MNFEPGALIKARGREWVVLPESKRDPDTLVVRPLGGSDDEITGIYLPLEPVTAADFRDPTASDLGNHHAGQLLRDALRIGFRSGAGPFRALSRLAIEIRPYQLVPLLLALRQDPVRLLIADDVGIGKTVEACLILRELWDRAEIRSFTVLCPPHLAEQWQRALLQQFHLETTLVLPSTAGRLERQIGTGEAIFERHPCTVVSLDYIKQQSRRQIFLNHAPDLVIVDEAHTSADNTGLSQQRYRLLEELVRKPKQHLILVTATPHNGKDHPFRSLLRLLDPAFADLPEDLSGEDNRKRREHLARHLVQRRRADVKAYLDSITPFPERTLAEATYRLDPTYAQLFERIMDWSRERLGTGVSKEARLRWWSVLSLLRAVSSSPRAALVSIENRSGLTELDDVNLIDEEGTRQSGDDELALDAMDLAPGARLAEDDPATFREFTQSLRALADPRRDTKLAKLAELIRQLLDQDLAPIVFCRFIPTAAYVAENLRELFKKGATKDVVIEAVDGTLPPEEREARVHQLAQHPRRVLVATDCLSEGINLQHAFSAVVHYDLAWSPTRHEQREGRVDRYGQPKAKVVTITLYGEDNPIDGMVLNVLLRKHQSIKKSLGVHVPLPTNQRAVEEAIREALILRKKKRGDDQLGFAFDSQVYQMHQAWDAVVEREKRSRTLYARNDLLIAVNAEVRLELEAARRALGGPLDVERFTRAALLALGATISDQTPFAANLAEVGAAVCDAMNIPYPAPKPRLTGVFDGVGSDTLPLLSRTHPAIAGLAAYVLESALDPHPKGPARRAAVIHTRAVAKRTTLLLLRLRCHLITPGPDGPQQLLAEDVLLAGFKGAPEQAEWLDDAQVEALLTAQPDANVAAPTRHLESIVAQLPALSAALASRAEAHGQKLLEAHRRVRKAAQAGLRRVSVQVHQPADILGVYIYLPVAGVNS